MKSSLDPFSILEVLTYTENTGTAILDEQSSMTGKGRVTRALPRELGKSIQILYRRI